ncbi:hypothetical protein [Parasphingopyxis marina]|uniref:Uncharacterized protein n=1 Tax=Parasphingopyxis marina TaxID=2761622 RepID=A0A842HVL8_9SPHN|nr:hypothetical protein [Parasphingopyxis marina]MBC2777146.1 hypothetical protein [Parasphingopyxis marina]
MHRFAMPCLAVAAALVSTPAAAQSVTLPDTIVFGTSHDALAEGLEAHCTEARSRVIDPPFLPGVEAEQLQIDCDGFAFMGEPRFAEFVIRDDSLEMIWILVDEDDEDRIIAAMREAYGEQGIEAGGMIAFPEHRTAWRFEPPEILFYSEALAPLMEAAIAADSSE